MKVKELLSYKLSKEETYKSDLANMILNAFNGSYKPHCFGNIQFSTNNSNGYRIIFVEDKGFTIIQGDGDSIYGLIADELTCRYTRCDSNEICFIESFEYFLDCVLDKVFQKHFTYKEVFKNSTVQKVLLNNHCFYYNNYKIHKLTDNSLVACWEVIDMKNTKNKFYSEWWNEMPTDSDRIALKELEQLYNKIQNG